MASIKYQLLKKKRKEKKLTQGDVADKVGIARSYYTRIELGDVEPSITTLKRIATVLNASVTDFIQ
jgi:transcriptional regulator with XRE-family HTH domain